MQKPLLWIVAMSTAASVPSAVAACDLDGIPGFGGLHRFNPFAKSISPAPAPDQRPSSSRSSSGGQADSSRDEERSQGNRRRGGQDNVERPKRAWESDEGNGSITAEDKATFT